MQDKRFTLDTNILVYAVDRDAGDRHGTAINLVDKAVQQDCILTLQALSEFFYAVTRKAFARRLITVRVDAKITPVNQS